MATIKDKLNTINTSLDTLKTNFNLEENASINDIASAAIPTKGFVITKWTEDGYAEEVKILDPTFHFNYMPFVGTDSETGNGNILGGKLKKVILPEGMTSDSFFDSSWYGYYFAYMPEFIEVNLPESLTTLTYGFFYYLPKFNIKTLPDNITRIQGRAFRNCPKITQLSMSNVATFDSSSWADAPFMMNANLCALWLGSAMTNLGKALIYDCPKMKWIFIDKPRADVEKYAGYSIHFACDTSYNMSSYSQNIQIICNDDPEWISKEEFNNINWKERLENE